MTVAQAAQALGVVSSTICRHINEGLIVAEQLTPGAPWRIWITDELRARYVAQAPEGYVPVQEAKRILGVSRQTIWQRVKRGEMKAIFVSRGKHKGIRILVLDDQLPLFEGTREKGV